MTAVGHTPLVEVNGIFAKLECTNPCGSIKDRIASYILEKSEERGLLRPGMRIIEATSGNTGISLAFFARRKGYEVTIVMPENMTEERKRIIRDLGAELILCSVEGSFAEAAAIRDRLAKENGWFNPDQFSNPLNVECHFETTGREILEQMPGRKIGAFVAGVGTGGTLIGVGRRIRAAFPDARIVAVEPEESAVMSGGAAGAHSIYGIGDGFVPAIVEEQRSLVDDVIRISGNDAKNSAAWIMDKYGYCVGISSGANYLAAQEIAEEYGTVVTVFADGYAKYLSEGLRHCAPGACPFEHRPVTG